MKLPEKAPAADTMHIVMNLDENYAPHCGVAIASVLHNNKKADIHFHILGLGISEDSKSKFRELVESRGKRLSLYEVDDNMVRSMPNLENHHVSSASYIRLFIAEILPSHIDKVLYLDSDLIVRHGIGELWRTDIEGAALAAIEDVLDSKESVCILYDYERYNYFNAGVMLINLKYWRDNDLIEKFTGFIEKYYDEIVCHEQDVLNGVLFDKKIFVPHTWNMMHHYLDKNIFLKRPDIHDNYGKDPRIVHFTYRVKPWNSIGYRPFFSEYHKYRKMTPWKRDKQQYKELRKAATTKHLLRTWLRIEKMLFDRRIRKARARAKTI